MTNSSYTRHITKSPTRELRPLLKWAGGKRQLLPALRRFYPARFANYIEPFFGSGAVFFDLQASGRLDGREALLLDSNPDLIGCYTSVRDAPDEVLGELDRLAERHARGGAAQYYAVRDERFNPLREGLRGRDGAIAYTPELAAIFIYLNRTGFNGLFRVNGSGAFNVPAGRYTRPRIVDRSRLHAVAQALRAPGVRLQLGSFENALAFASPGDFAYLDPPYAPLSSTANFTAYTADGFSMADQARLHAAVVALAARGCWVVLSNSSAPELEALYRAGTSIPDTRLRIYRLPARRSINSRPSGRGAVMELLITNVPSASRRS